MKFNALDIRKLPTFLAVYAAGGLQDAARALRVTPSAVSVALKGFEEALGERLFVRTGRAMTPTATAHRLAALAAPFAADLAAFAADARSRRGRMQGRIRLGVPAQFGTAVVIPAIARFRAEHPDVSFRVRFGEPSTLLPALHAAAFDAVVCDDGPYLKRETQLVMRPLASETLLLVGSRAMHDRALDGAVTFDRLRRVPHVAYAENQQDLQKWYLHHFRRAPRLDTPVVADSVHAVLAAVRAGLGLGMVPESLVAADLEAGALVAVRTRKRALRNEMLLLRLKERVPSLAEKAFVDQLKAPRKAPP